jgi:hypothetical protein
MEVSNMSRITRTTKARTTEKASAASDLAEDILWGVAGKNGIAAFLNIPIPKAYYLIERNKIPVRRHGHRTISASRSELRRHFTSSTD